MGDIRFRSKKDGKVKYVADSKGNIGVVGKDGKIKQTLSPNESGKAETIKIKPQDLK